MKKGLLIAGASLLGSGGLGIVGLIVWFVFALRRQSESIGIIGGADAPTAIFLTSRLEPLFVAVFVPLFLCIFVGAGLLAAAVIMHIRKEPED
ncbi:MAG: hypothetical protein IKG98_01795 [Ruminococcus sp.]|nr:hypothetical protein [Ruminococcus sp.]